MVTYIYLNTYNTKSGVYHYVGSHTWDGPAGQLDPNYHGSSAIASRYKWIPSTIRLLETFEAGHVEKLKREQYWIEFFARQYGIAKIACHSRGNCRPNVWQAKFRLNGTLLNAHANTCEVAIEAARSPEVRKRAVDSRLKSGKHNYNELNVIAAAKGIRRKAVETAIANGSMDRMVAAMHSKEAQKKAIQSKLEKGVTRTSAAIATAAFVAKSRHYAVSGFTGTLKQCCEFLGFNVNTVKNYAKCGTSFVFRGVEFKLI